MFKCSYCGKEFESSRKLGSHKGFGCKLNPNSTRNNKIFKKRKELSLEHKMSISNSMVIAHKEKRAWNIGKSRWNNEKSYPEIFFEKVILNEFNDKNYICEYSVGIYSLDFAWPHLKKCIEIDGSQHHRYKEYIERDKRKDLFLESNGWKVMRIEWKTLFSNTKEEILKAKNFISSEI